MLAGGNDLFIDRALTVDAQVQGILAGEQAGTITAAAAAGDRRRGRQRGQAMTPAGTQLAALVNTQIIAKGATHVVVVNLPDVSLTPDNATWLPAGAGHMSIRSTRT